MTEDRRCFGCAHCDFIFMTNLESGRTVVYFTWLCRRGKKSRKVEMNDTCNHWKELGSDEVERLIDIVSVQQTGPKKYRLNADALREWMARTHTTQKQLAKMVGVTACMPSQWLNGTSEPRTSTMLNLADVTGMSIYDLMEVDDGDR